MQLDIRFFQEKKGITLLILHLAAANISFLSKWEKGSWSCWSRCCTLEECYGKSLQMNSLLLCFALLLFSFFFFGFVTMLCTYFCAFMFLLMLAVLYSSASLTRGFSVDIFKVLLKFHSNLINSLYVIFLIWIVDSLRKIHVEI